MEDILSVFDGRAELVAEIGQAEAGIKSYISEELGQLLEHPDFDYVVQSTDQGQGDREALIFERLEAVIK